MRALFKFHCTMSFLWESSELTTCFSVKAATSVGIALVISHSFGSFSVSPDSVCLVQASTPATIFFRSTKLILPHIQGSPCDVQIYILRYKLHCKMLFQLLMESLCLDYFVSNNHGHPQNKNKNHGLKTCHSESHISVPDTLHVQARQVRRVKACTPHSAASPCGAVPGNRPTARRRYAAPGRRRRWWR